MQAENSGNWLQKVIKVLPPLSQARRSDTLRCCKTHEQAWLGPAASAASIISKHSSCSSVQSVVPETNSALHRKPKLQVRGSVLVVFNHICCGTLTGGVLSCSETGLSLWTKLSFVEHKVHTGTRSARHLGELCAQLSLFTLVRIARALRFI